jgi:rod shape determining protein RodA
MSKINPSPIKKTFHIDYPLSIALVLLITISILAIYASGPMLQSFQDGYQMAFRQGIWALISLTFLIILVNLGVDRIFTAIDIAYWILIFLLFLLLLDRFINLPLISPVNGTRAWIVIPGLGTIQPSEFMKTVLIIKAANTITSHHAQHPISNYEHDFKLFLKIARFALIPIIMVILQPDTGIPVVMLIGLFVMVALSGIRPGWLIWIFGVVTFLVLVFFMLFYWSPDVLVNLVGGSYRLTRFYGWLQTESFIRSWGLQLYQSLLAVGSAGLFGHGYGSYVINLIEPQNDFIFAVIAQNFGFIGATVVLSIQLWLNFIIVRIILKCPDYRERIMAVGILGMMMFQQVQNMGMIIGVFPITGITLPFISAGGSSLLSFVPALAILYHMSDTNRHRTFY